MNPTLIAAVAGVVGVLGGWWLKHRQVSTSAPASGTPANPVVLPAVTQPATASPAPASDPTAQLMAFFLQLSHLQVSIPGHPVLQQAMALVGQLLTNPGAAGTAPPLQQALGLVVQLLAGAAQQAVAAAAAPPAPSLTVPAPVMPAPAPAK